MNTTHIKTFNYLENGDVSFSVLDTIKSTAKLDAGSYSVEYNIFCNPPVLELKTLDLGEVYTPANFHFIPKLEEIFNKFFNNKIKTKINSLGYAHKLGIMLYGKQGTSKSSIFSYYANKFIKDEKILYFYIKGGIQGIRGCWDFIKKVRKIQDNPIIICFDECDKFFPDYEQDFKPMLDGNLEIDNCICFFATNYIEKIPVTISERPSRIKYKWEVESIEDESVIKKIYTKALNDILTEEEIDEAVINSKGSTMDELKEFIQDTIMHINFEKTKRKTIGFK